MTTERTTATWSTMARCISRSAVGRIRGPWHSRSSSRTNFTCSHISHSVWLRWRLLGAKWHAVFSFPTFCGKLLFAKSGNELPHSPLPESEHLCDTNSNKAIDVHLECAQCVRINDNNKWIVNARRPPPLCNSPDVYSATFQPVQRAPLLHI